MSSIYAFKSSKHQYGVTINAYKDLLNIYTQLNQHNQKFLNAFQTLLDIKDNDQKTAFLQQPNEMLSYELIIYFVFHDYSYFVNNIKPFLQYRSKGVLDTWLYYFSESMMNEKFVPDESVKELVNEMAISFTMRRSEYNAVEVIFMVHMLSYYSDVSELLENINKEMISCYDWTQNTIQKLAKVLLLHEEIQSQEESLTQHERSQMQQAKFASKQNFNPENSLIIAEDQCYEEIYYYSSNEVPAHTLQFRFSFFYQILRYLLKREKVRPLSIFEVLVNGTQKEALFALMMCSKMLFEHIQLSTKKPIENKDLKIIDSLISENVTDLTNIETIFKCQVEFSNIELKVNQNNTINVFIKMQNFSDTQQPVTVILAFLGDIYTLTGDQTYKQNFILEPNNETKHSISCKCVVYSYNASVKIQVLHNDTTEIYEKTAALTYGKDNLLNKRINRQAIILYLYNTTTEQKKILFEYILKHKYQHLLQGDDDYLNYIVPHILTLQEYTQLQIELLSHILIQNKNSQVISIVENILEQLIEQSLNQQLNNAQNQAQDKLVKILIKWMSNTPLNEMEYFFLIGKYLRAGKVKTAEILLNDTQYQNVQNKTLKTLLSSAHALASLDTDKFINSFKNIDKAELLGKDNISLYQKLQTYYNKHLEVSKEVEHGTMEPVARIHDNRYLQLEGDTGAVFHVKIKYVNPLFYSSQQITTLKYDYQFETQQGEIDLFELPNITSNTFEISVMAKGAQVLCQLFTKKQINIQIFKENGYISVSRSKEKEKLYVIVKLDGAFYKDGFVDQNGLFDYFNISYANPGNGVEFQIMVMDEDKNFSSITVECVAPEAFMIRSE